MSTATPPSRPSPAGEPAIPAPPGAPPPARHRWRGVIAALFALVLIPALPQARALIPIEETMMLIVPALAACAVVGWLRGGRIWLVLIWCALAAWTLTRPFPGMGAAYGDLVRGWALLVAGAFAVVSLLAKDLRFFPRALISLLLAIATSVAVTAPRADGLSRVREVLAERIAERNAAAVSAVQALLSSSGGWWRDLLAGSTTADKTAEMLDRIAAFGVAYFPALLALETLAALAVAYALYHRIARARIGDALAPLREFRFNDQLVWGLVVGLTIAVLPTFISLRGTGRNLLAFFGALYGLRAMGVLQWLWGRAAGAVWVLALILVLPAVGAIARALLVSLLLSIGVSDSWLDWRRRLVK